jgi:hypothetical protein
VNLDVIEPSAMKERLRQGDAEMFQAMDLCRSTSMQHGRDKSIPHASVAR